MTHLKPFFLLIAILISTSISAQTDSSSIILPEADTISSADIPAAADTPAPTYSQYTIVGHYDTLKVNYNYWLCTPPGYDSTSRSTTTQLPLIVHLHGASLCGRDLTRAKRYGPLDALRYGRQINAIILNPQNPGGAWKPKKINDLIDTVIKNHNIDTTRIYVLGMSLGGYGTMDYCATYPERVAAGMALCGGLTADYRGLSKLPLWIVHGTADRAVSIKCSKDVVAKLEADSLTDLLKYTWIKNASHSALARMFYMPKTYDWLFSHSLADSVRHINRDCEFTLDEIRNAYTNIDKTANKLSVSNHNPNPKLFPSWDDGIDYTNCEVYVVKSGDVLVNIAKKTHTTVDRICQLNHISRTSTLRIGQKLKIRAK